MGEKLGGHYLEVSGVLVRYGIYSSSKSEVVGRGGGGRFKLREKI